jgi:hypothetical protein
MPGDAFALLDDRASGRPTTSPQVPSTMKIVLVLMRANWTKWLWLVWKDITQPKRVDYIVLALRPIISCKTVDPDAIAIEPHTKRSVIGAVPRPGTTDHGPRHFAAKLNRCAL